ncbi:hypothetical protein CFK39_08590 [Brachybacterium avium]|uniref:Uncharacterized protein n=1 Tax=Brachybacterium avium TaxID=2017485 RepID=A0A220UD82_9MICO|nr:hypothetical protein [Brachybacterium avium]ASK65876.1 hypothetical protein CFK39_08590 [Brachybacterium avium]
MSAEQGPSAEPPTSGNNRFPDPFAPAPPVPTGSRGSTDASAPAGSDARTPGDRDLPWKATAERRDLWGPIEKPLQGTVHSPASKAVGRPRRSPLVRFGAPVLLGGLAAVLTLVVGLGAGLAGPLLALAAAAGIGVVTLGGSGALLNAPRRDQEERPVLDASVPDSTRAVLTRILDADAATREELSVLRPQASSTPSAATVLDDVDGLVTRIDALVATEQLQSLRPSTGEVTMLEGIACRYVPDLVEAASDTIGFLQTFEGSARQEALENLESIGRQLSVLAEGVEQIETDLVGGVSRSLEVHAEFLRARFADQHLNPIIDV